VVGASLVCSVDSTRWPVCAALMDFGGFEVADFAHHDHVGILPQEGLERGSEGEAGLVVDVDLIDAGQVDFGRDLRRSRC
jgi:hypothetical protein